MISFKTIKEIVTLIESGVDPDVISNIFKMDSKRIKSIYKNSKNMIFKGVDEQSTYQSASSGSPGTQSPSQPSSTKWGSGVSRGKANPIDQKSKWESGISRGKANPLP